MLWVDLDVERQPPLRRQALLPDRHRRRASSDTHRRVDVQVRALAIQPRAVCRADQDPIHARRCAPRQLDCLRPVCELPRSQVHPSVLLKHPGFPNFRSPFPTARRGNIHQPTPTALHSVGQHARGGAETHTANSSLRRGCPELEGMKR
eukprot:2957787-Rhodomonas_salina.3